jgi:hypothetical protein
MKRWVEILLTPRKIFILTSKLQTRKLNTNTRSLTNHPMYNLISEYNPAPTRFSVHSSLTSLSLSINSTQGNTAQSYSDHHTPFSAVVANPEPVLQLQPVPAAPCHAEKAISASFSYWSSLEVCWDRGC